MHINVHPTTLTQVFIFLATNSLLSMASMGFGYAQIHVRQEKVRRRISEKAVATMTKNKSTAEQGEENTKDESLMAEEQKAVRNSRTAGRVHPCTSSTAAASSPTDGHH
uniref:Uncharacterized protein n=1 Tax=Avena sativa TaxID=4498 RepID=A0ACD5X4L6_AVESA